MCVKIFFYWTVASRNSGSFGCCREEHLDQLRLPLYYLEDPISANIPTRLYSAGSHNSNQMKSFWLMRRSATQEMYVRKFSKVWGKPKTLNPTSEKQFMVNFEVRKQSIEIDPVNLVSPLHKLFHNLKLANTGCSHLWQIFWFDFKTHKSAATSRDQ